MPAAAPVWTEGTPALRKPTPCRPADPTPSPADFGMPGERSVFPRCHGQRPRAGSQDLGRSLEGAGLCDPEAVPQPSTPVPALSPLFLGGGAPTISASPPRLESQIHKTTMRPHLTPINKAATKTHTALKTTSVGEEGRNWSPCTLLAGMEDGAQLLRKTERRFLKK